MRVGPGLGRMAVGFEASHTTRAVAVFRHMTGVPTDREPLAAT